MSRLDRRYLLLVRTLRDERGISLIEFALYAGLLLVLLSVVLPLLHIFVEPVQSLAYTRMDQEAQIFFQQIAREIRQGQAVHVTENGAEAEVTMDASNRYRYEQYGDVVRRVHVERGGHYVFASYVDKVTFTERTDHETGRQLLHIHLRLQHEGQSYEADRAILLRSGKRQ